MGLQKDAISACGKSCMGKRVDVFALATTNASRSARNLHTMCRIENSWVSVVCHYTEATHIYDEILIPECSAALGLPNFFRPRRIQFIGDKCHLMWREKLPFLYVDRTASRCSSCEEIGLATEKCRNLENINMFRNYCALLGMMNVCYCL